MVQACRWWCSGEGDIHFGTQCPLVPNEHCLMSQPTCVSFLIMSISLWPHCTHLLMAISSRTLARRHAMSQSLYHLLYLHTHQMSIQIQKGIQPNSKVYLMNICGSIFSIFSMLCKWLLPQEVKMLNDEFFTHWYTHIICHLAWEKNCM